MRAQSVNPSSPSALRAALGWWALAGVDVLLAPEPTPWLSAAPQPRPDAPAETVANAGAGVGGGIMAPRAGAAPAPASRARPAPPAQPTPVAPLPAVDSIAAWRAALAERHPDAVALDGAAEGGLLLLGDAPALADVDAGRPFAGDAGLLLDRMLRAIGRDRGSAALANLSFWPAHRDDGPALARPWIERLVVLAAPRVVVTLGAPAAMALLGADVALPRVRGRWHEARIGGHDVALLPTFHPADLLRAPARKALAWADLLTLAARIET